LNAAAAVLGRTNGSDQVPLRYGIGIPKDILIAIRITQAQDFGRDDDFRMLMLR
jgi:hypothetical protein